MDIAKRQKPSPGGLLLDHVSHFVPDLDAAAATLEALGFVVTPSSSQNTETGPAGASNRCVMLEAGYLELLAPTGDTPIARHMRGRMEKFIGVHLACFGTPDAEAEHARLAVHGFEPQPLVHLERKLHDASVVRFKVARPDLQAMPEGRIQYVQQLNPEAIWTERNLAHRNGVKALQAVFVVADAPARAAARWARFSGLLPRHEGDLIALESARGRVLVGTRMQLAGLLGEVPAAPPALAGYALGCSHPKAFAARCSGLGLAVRKTAGGHAVSLPPFLGGVWLV